MTSIRNALGATAAVCLIFSQAINAEDLPFVEATLFGGYRVGGAFENAVDGSRRDVNEHTSYGATINLRQSADAYYELTYSRQATQLQGATPFDLSIEYLHIGGRIDFADDARIVPYFALTVGATRFTPNQTSLQSATKFSVGAAGGLKIPFSTRIALRTEARGFVTLMNADSQIFCVSSSSITCDIRVQGDSFVQIEGSIGVTIDF